MQCLDSKSVKETMTNGPMMSNIKITNNYCMTMMMMMMRRRMDDEDEDSCDL